MLTYCYIVCCSVVFYVALVCDVLCCVVDLRIMYDVVYCVVYFSDIDLCLFYYVADYVCFCLLCLVLSDVVICLLYVVADYICVCLLYLNVSDAGL